MLTFLVIFCLLLGTAACGKQKDEDSSDNLNVEGTTVEEGDPDYNVEEDLVEGLLTDDMLDQMEELP